MSSKIPNKKMLLFIEDQISVNRSIYNNNKSDFFDFCIKEFLSKFIFYNIDDINTIECKKIFMNRHLSKYEKEQIREKSGDSSNPYE